MVKHVVRTQPAKVWDQTLRVRLSGSPSQTKQSALGKANKAGTAKGISPPETLSSPAAPDPPPQPLEGLLVLTGCSEKGTNASF